MTLSRGDTDASLSPHHVNRGKLFVLKGGADAPYIDAQRLASAIELTCFQVSDSDGHQQTKTEARLVRAADLIGQLTDAGYPGKTTHLFM